MLLFKHANAKLTPVSESRFDLEKDLQKLAEGNLEAIFSLEFVKTEFSLNNLRIDTLAFDRETQSFTIIEYKRDRNFSVIDQGYAYLPLLLNNKAEFLLAYNETLGKNLKKDAVDWSQSRVIFLARSFTTYQLQAITFRDLPIELWEARQFTDGILVFNQLKSLDTSASIKEVSKSAVAQEVSREIRAYTVDDHLAGKSQAIKDAVSALREGVLALGSEIVERPTKTYLGYQLGNRVFVLFKVYHTRVEVRLNLLPKREATDSQGILEEMPGGYDKNASRFYLSRPDQVSYALSLIRQAYERMT